MSVLTIVVGEGTLVGVLDTPDSGHPVVESVPVLLSDDPGPALRRGLGQLQEALGIEGEIRVRAALLPPLAELRLISLPPLRPEETRAVLTRDAHRHFVGRSQPLLVGATRVGDQRIVAAAAARPLVDALLEAVEGRGWTLERIAPAQAAWIKLLGDGPGVQLLIAIVGTTTHLIRTTDGRPDRIRRIPLQDRAEILGAAGPEPGRMVVLGPGTDRAGLLATLRSEGWVDSGEDHEPATAAALHADTAEPELLPESLAEARRSRSRRTTVRLVAAAVVLIAAAAVVHLWGTAREYRVVQQERTELREIVAPALAARDSLDRMNARLEALQSIGGESARWSYALVELSMVLPSEVHLVSLQAAGDTVVLEAEGGRAGDALDALSNASSLRDVRLEGMIQRDLEQGTTSRERFTLSALLADGDAP